MFHSFIIRELLILDIFLSWRSFQQQNKILTRVNDQVGTKTADTGRVSSSGFTRLRGGESGLSQWPQFVVLREGKLAEGPGPGPRKSYSDQMSTVNGVWPRIFDNFEVLKFYQVLLSNITMIFLGTGTTGWERISYWRLLFFSTSKQKLLINVKASHRILLRIHLPSFQYWWEQLDPLDYGRTELITVFYCYCFLVTRAV